jgi:MscS family membrane protein
MTLANFKQFIHDILPPMMFDEFLGLTLWQYGYLFALILVAFIIQRIIQYLLETQIVNILARSGVVIDERNKKFFIIPSGVIIFTLTLRAGLAIPFLPEKLKFILDQGAYIGFTIAIVLASYHLVDVIMLYLEKKAADTANKFDDIFVPLLRKTSKTFILLMGIVIVGEALTLDMKSLLAGLGIGGLAFALAAKDTVGNLFGSLTIVLDRPFQIGDWVVIDGKVEGMIEQVGLRSCRIRTFYDSLISLPNGQLTNVSIDNYGKRTYRRYSTSISIEYDTPVELIEQFCEGIRDIIKAHPFTRKDTYHVYLNDMSASSLDIMLYVFWQVPNWPAELHERHRLLIDIIKLARDIGVGFAFPTQTIHIANNETNPVSSPDLSS